MTEISSWIRSGIEAARQGHEDAQAMIFFALLAMTIAFTLGLAMEGGSLYTQYRQLQSAADMSALVAAQSLPCNIGDSTCIGNVETLACQTASNNGFSTCNNGSAPGAMVPPVTCSPYDNIDYGNDNGDTNGDSSCKTAITPATFYDYVEVALQKNVGTVPIFNVPVTLSAHAVARHGVPSPKDWAVAQLDSNTCAQCGLSVGGNFTWFVNGSTFANGPLSMGNNATSTACEGGFFTAQSSQSDGGAQTYSGGIAGFAPPACYKNDGVTLQTTSSNDFESNLPAISDAYCNSISPPYSGNVGTNCHGAQNGNFTNTSIPNCIPCTSAGWYYDITTNVWSVGGNLSPANNSHDSYEVFPGVYGNLSVPNNAHMYFNPGIYTFTGSVSFDTGNICMFGAPICDSGASPGRCADTTVGNSGYAYWTPGPSAGSSAKGNTWYYHCSPYGFYDTGLKRPGSSSGGAATTSCPSSPGPGNDVAFGPSCIVPTYWDTTGTNSYSPLINNGVGHVSAVPLNGMTWYFTSTSNNAIGGSGSGNSTLPYFVPAPNPCPGTAASWTTGTHSVSFNNGDRLAQFDYQNVDSWTSTPAGPDNPSQIPMRAGFTAGTYSSTYTTSPIVPNWGWEQVNGNWVEDVSASQIYPSMDLSLNGECSPNNFEVWPGELGGAKGQHVHFAFFDRKDNLWKFAGNQGQSFIGIIYLPGPETGDSPVFDVTGSGAAGGGIPFIWGQIVAWNIKFSGSGAVDLIYRPCNDQVEVCSSGYGTQIIQ